MASGRTRRTPGRFGSWAGLCVLALGCASVAYAGSSSARLAVRACVVEAGGIGEASIGAGGSDSSQVVTRAPRGVVYRVEVGSGRTGHRGCYLGTGSSQPLLLQGGRPGHGHHRPDPPTTPVVMTVNF